MAATKVKYVMEGPHKGKDFAPRNHPNFAFEKGVLEMTVDAASVPALDRILGGYGAKRSDAADESKPAAKAPAKKKTTAKKTAAAAKPKDEVKDAAKEPDQEADGDQVQPTGDGAAQGDAADGGSNDDSDAGSQGGDAEQSDGAGSENEEEMI